MSKELTALAQSTIKIKQVHNFGKDWTSLPFEAGSYKTCSQTETSSRAAPDVSITLKYLLYQPSFIGKEACGFHDTSYQYNTRWGADSVPEGP